MWYTSFIRLVWVSKHPNHDCKAVSQTLGKQNRNVYKYTKGKGQVDMVKVFHGSEHIIKNPQYMGGKSDNDYGNGFYTTEYEDRARVWATLNGNPDKSIVNVYHLDTEALKILDLNDHGVLAWVAEVVANRGTNQEAASIVGSRLVELYRPDLNGYDVIKGYRADDSYTQVVEAFLMNQINIFEVQRLFYKGSLGNQIFIKSEKAFNTIQWIEAYQVTMQEEYKNTDLLARREVGRFLSERMKAILLDGYEVTGITARYAIQNKLTYQIETGGYAHACI